jgi:hypothetical protein
MKENFELRNKPELKFILNENELKIIDNSDHENTGTYSYGEIKSIKLNKERTNWFVSFLSFIVDLIIGSGANGQTFKNKASLDLELNSKKVRILLFGVNFSKAEKIAGSIKEKTNTQQHA